MGAQLDLDDVVHGHPLAIVELADLRARVVLLDQRLMNALTMLQEWTHVESWTDYQKMHAKTMQATADYLVDAMPKPKTK